MGKVEPVQFVEPDDGIVTAELIILRKLNELIAAHNEQEEYIANLRKGAKEILDRRNANPKG